MKGSLENTKCFFYGIAVKPLFLRMHPLFTTNTLLQAWEDHNQPYLFPWRATVHEFQFNKGKLGRLGCPIADSNWSGRSTKSSPPLLPGFSVNKRSLPTCEGKHRVGVIENALLWCCLILNTEINSMLNVLKHLSNSKCTIYAATRALIIHLMLELLT